MEISLGDLFLNEHQKNQVQKIILYLNSIEKEYKLFNIFLVFSTVQLRWLFSTSITKTIRAKVDFI